MVRTAPVVGREDRLAAADPPCRAPSGCCGRHGPATRRMPPLEAYEPPNSGHIRPGERHTRTGEGRPAGRLSSNPHIWRHTRTGKRRWPTNPRLRTPHIWRHTRTDKRQPLEVKKEWEKVPRQNRRRHSLCGEGISAAFFRRALEVAAEAASSNSIGVLLTAAGVASRLTDPSTQRRQVAAWHQLTRASPLRPSAGVVQRPSVPGRPRCCGHRYGSPPPRLPRRSPCRSDGSVL